MFGSSKSTGESKTQGENCWRFYNSSGELISTASASASRWETLANGITASPEVVFNLGDTIAVEIFS